MKRNAKKAAAAIQVNKIVISDDSIKKVAEHNPRLAEVLGNKPLAKAAIRKLTPKHCEFLIEIATEVMEEKREAERQALRLEMERDAAIERAKELLNGVGISLDTAALNMKSRRKSTTPEDKYQITDVHGFVRSWSGKGHTPFQFKQAFKMGITKEECLKELHRTLTVAFEETSKCEKHAV